MAELEEMDGAAGGDDDEDEDASEEEEDGEGDEGVVHRNLEKAEGEEVRRFISNIFFSPFQCGKKAQEDSRERFNDVGELMEPSLSGATR